MSEDRTDHCPRCLGSGKAVVTMTQQTAFHSPHSGVQQAQHVNVVQGFKEEPCPVCKGTGKLQ